jgi:predicted nucleotidyltransferase
VRKRTVLLDGFGGSKLLSGDNVPLPSFNKTGDLPVGIHRASLHETVKRFGTKTNKRKALALRLERIHRLASETGQLARFIVFGSFVTAKPEPNDVDVFILMEDTFDVGQLSGEARLLFDHAAAQAHFGASIFWLRRLAALNGEQTTIEHWQIKRDGSQRGIVEIILE